MPRVVQIFVFFFLVILLQSNLDYPDSLGLGRIVQIIAGLHNQKCKY